MNPGSQDILAMEAAAFASWPAIDGAEDHLGWHLRFGSGYTKRANSANSSADAAMLSDGQIDEIAQRYRRRGLPPIFRLVSATVPAGMDAALERLGYRHVDRSLVMARPLADAGENGLPPLAQDAGHWLADFVRASDAAIAQHEVHLRMLRMIRGECAFAVERRDGEPACLALGVLVDGQLGLFDVVTSPWYRRQGLARQLCTRLLAWGRAHGAHSAYLQVVANNRAAIGLYEQMGFREAYHYWYRVGG